MKIILRKNLENLGNIGDVVSVKNGYARNYLIPNNLAFIATDDAVKRIEREKMKLINQLTKEKENAESISQALSNIQLTIPMRTTEEGNLYGSITNQLISEKLAELNFNIDKRNIIIDEPIKTLGIFDVKIKLHTDVTTTIKVWVINEEEQ
ncbi:MAG TPA: 50S ribosomal protein L9 [Candidatus Kapabacteria bacterium]|jgi:large subunit ribosomal protein L9|nr:50S ribosomal protein L9 [Candidatus Kapabacteria bacterium]HOV92375.1 50S ribosomal protein L9 [Candidatus Kapabacteria bacterium]